MTYGNGLVVKHLYDALDRVEEIRYNNVKVYTYSYDGSEKDGKTAYDYAMEKGRIEIAELLKP